MIIQQFVNTKTYMYSLLDYIVLISCSKPSRNRFSRFDRNRFRFWKWNTPWVTFFIMVTSVLPVARV